MGGFIWYELMSENPAKASKFYGDVIGWTVADESSAPEGMDYRMIQRSDGKMAGGLLVLTEDMKSGGAKPGWFGYLHTPDVDATFAAIIGKGGSALLEPHDLPGVGRIAFVSDPQGAAIYLMTPTPPADDPAAVSDVFSVDRPQHCRWNQLQTSDYKAAIANYCSLFGWTQEGSMPMGPVGDYCFVQNEGVNIGAIMPLMDDVTNPVWSYFFGVDDIDRAVAAVERGGGQLDSPLQQIPGGEYSVHCFDPEGAGFGLVGPRKEG